MAKEPGHRGEHGVSRKPLRGECWVISGVTVVTMLVCSYHFAHKAAGASCARHSLRPLMFKGATSIAKLARKARRDREALPRRHCEERLVRRSSTSEGGSDEAIPTTRPIVIPRESGVSSTLRPLGSSAGLWNTGPPAFAGGDYREWGMSIRSADLTNFWHCGLPHFSFRTVAESAPRQRTVNGFGRELGFQRVWQC